MMQSTVLENGMNDYICTCMLVDRVTPVHIAFFNTTPYHMNLVVYPGIGYPTCMLLNFAGSSIGQTLVINLAIHPRIMYSLCMLSNYSPRSMVYSTCMFFLTSFAFAGMVWTKAHL